MLVSLFSLGTKRWAFGKQEWNIPAYPNSVTLWEMVQERQAVHLRQNQQVSNNLPVNIHFINDLSFTVYCDYLEHLFITFIGASRILLNVFIRFPGLLRNFERLS